MWVCEKLPAQSDLPIHVTHYNSRVPPEGKKIKVQHPVSAPAANGELFSTKTWACLARQLVGVHQINNKKVAVHDRPRFVRQLHS